jgi:hypothetical protein
VKQKIGTAFDEKDKGSLNHEAAHPDTWAALQRSGGDIILLYASNHTKE